MNVLLDNYNEETINHSHSECSNHKSLNKRLFDVLMVSKYQGHLNYPYPFLLQIKVI